MAKKSTTLLDIAKELEIDVSTVSKALKNHPKISDDTIKRVNRVANDLNYHPNNIAASLVRGKSNLLGVMVPHIDENFFASVIRGIEEVAKKNGYHIIIFQSNDNYEDEVKNIEIMYQAKVDGILASHAMGTKKFDHFQNIVDRGIPLILFDRFDESVDSDVVAINDFKGAYKAVTHLIKQGCQKIVHFSGYEHVYIYKERCRGYREALLDHDLLFDESMVFESDMSLESGRELTAKILKNNTIPDAIFAANDYTALGAIQVLKEHNIKIPEQVSVVGFSNESFTSFVSPTITSVEQYSRKMGNITAQLFVEYTKDESDAKEIKIPKKTILSPKLIVRESSSKR